MFSFQYSIKGQTCRCHGIEKWSELKADKFLPVVRTLHMMGKQQEAKYQLPLLCSDIAKKDFLRFRPVQAALLLSRFDFLMEFQDLPSKWILKKIGVRHLIQKRYLPLGYLYGPSDNLANLDFEEFIYAEAMLDKYEKSGQEDHLDKFTAILYRPKKRDQNISGDVREVFNKHAVNAREKLMANVDIGIKLAVRLNYIGCKARFPSLYRELFTSTEPADNKNNESLTWLDVAYRTANHQPSEMQVIKRMNLHEVLAGLNLKVRDDKALKAEIEAMRRKK